MIRLPRLPATLSTIASYGLGAAFVAATIMSTAQAQEAEPPKAPASAPAAIASTLPGGASSLTEQHGDWTVTCAMAETGKRCEFSQNLVASQSGQRVLSLELTPTTDGAALQGTLLMPFSLRFDQGVKIAIDGQAPIGPLAFLTCVEVGCIVPVQFNTAHIVALRAGTALKVTATAVSNSQPIELTLSLAGFTAASNRTVELTK